MRARALFCLLLAACAGPRVNPDPAWKAGASRVKITPPQMTWLAGYGSRNKPAEGTSLDLHLRALAIEDGSGNRGVLVAADIIGFTPWLHRRIVAETKRRFGLGEEQVQLVASHTHSGPVISEGSAPREFYPMKEADARVVHEYAEVLFPRVIEAIDLSIKDLAPATLEFGRSSASFGMNRRVKRANGSFGFGANPEGVRDPDVPVLRVHAGGRLKAICYTYACHCTSVRSGKEGFYLYHADYAGRCSAILEEKNPGAVAMFVTGCGADLDPQALGGVEMADQHGASMAAAVEAARGFTPVEGPLQMKSSRVDLPLEKPDEAKLKELAAGKEGERKRFAERVLRRLADGSLDRAIPLPLKSWDFGGKLTLIAIGGEVCVDYALRLKRELGAERTWVSGYANEVPFYLPSERVLNEGGYEPGWNLETGRGVGAQSISGYGWPTPFAAGVEERVVNGVKELLASAPKADRDNRRVLLDSTDPYYPHLGFPKLVTPRWVGEEGVEAVVILGIDDMRGPQKWEAYLRPILERLKKIDGRAPVSIMTCTVEPDDPQLQAWLKEGLSLECHTIDHPCPILKDGDFKKAKSTYDRCVDLMGSIPNSKPVAFRVPCCDSLNTPSPRFYGHIFNERTEKGGFLQIDTSVFNIFTAEDPDVPRELVVDPDGNGKFLKYTPFDRSFVNTIRNYPYPYVLGDLCWEFPCVTPSDWQAQHYHKASNHPDTVRDMKAALDITVLKQGVYCLVFHPHGWIRNGQIVELIDHAVAKHGKKVKFLTFREALERLNRNLLGGRPIRKDPGGADSGVRLGDWDGDGSLDVRADPFDDGKPGPAALALPAGIGARDPGLRFVDLNGDGHDDIVFSNGERWGVYVLDPPGKGWRRVKEGRRGDPGEIPMIVRADGTSNGAWFHSGHMWVQNEDTAKMPNHVDRRTFGELLAPVR